MIRRRLQFPVTRHVLTATLVAIVQVIAPAEEAAPEFVIGGYL
jgi:hypothetical protein